MEKKKIDPKTLKDIRKDLNDHYLNPPFGIVIRKLLISIDFGFEYSPVNIPGEKKRIKNRLKRKNKK